MLRINKETIKNIGVGFFWLFLTSALIFSIVKFGLGAAVKLSEYLQKNQPGAGETLTDNFIPQPKFFPVLEATNSAELPVEGYSVANKEVILTLNNTEITSFPVDSEGKFKGFINLFLGENNFNAVTKDFEGKTSLPSETYKIFYSNTPPALEITEPVNASTIKNNPDIIIKGNTDSSSKVYINDHLAMVNAEGLFTYPVKLQKGENKFKIVCLDPAKNKTETEVIFQFKP